MMLAGILAVSILAPPVRYLPYDGPIVRIVRPLKQTGAICRALGLKEAATIYGCQTWGVGGCLEIVADIPERKLIEAHEDAHCNGWRH